MTDFLMGQNMKKNTNYAKTQKITIFQIQEGVDAPTGSPSPNDVPATEKAAPP